MGTAYRGLYEHPRNPHDSPDLTFLTGDQVYLDVGFDLRSWVPKEVRRRIAQGLRLPLEGPQRRVDPWGHLHAA